MASEFQVHKLIANEALRLLMNEIVLAGLVYRGYESEYRSINGHKVGDTINVPVPARFQSINGPDVTGQLQDVVEGSKPLKLNKQRTVPISLDVRQITTDADIKRVSEMVLQDAVGKLVQDIETDIAGLYYKIGNSVGTAGSTPNSTLLIGQSASRLTNLGVPMTNRRTVMDPDANLNIAEQLKTLYIDGRNKSALEQTSIGKIHKHDTYTCASLASHTAGNWAGAPAVRGANQKLSYTGLQADGVTNVRNSWYQDLIVDGFTAAGQALKKGDNFTIAGVYEVNPSTRQSTGKLRQFTVIADVNSAAAGAAGGTTVRISPPIIPVDSAALVDQANATVTTTPAAGALITTLMGASGTVSKQNLSFHKNAFLLVVKPLQKLDSFPVWETRSKDGLSVTLSKGADILTHKETWRLDVLYGVDTLQPELGCRVYG